MRELDLSRLLLFVPVNEMKKTPMRRLDMIDLMEAAIGIEPMNKGFTE
jgi:hypothetical protein